MNQLQVFENSAFGAVRTVEEDGKILFCGSDVARSLGYSNSNDAIIRHCKGIVKRDTPTSGGIQSLSFITEGDLYRLITNSKLPSAEQFESWVFDEVLPSIRKHGIYATTTTIEDMIANPDHAIKLLEALKVEREAKTAIEAENKRLIAEVSHKEGVITGLVEDVDAYTMRTVINRVVRRSGSPAERYRELYRVFRETNHVDLNERIKNYNAKQLKKCDQLNQIGYAEKFGHIKALYETAIKLYEADEEQILAEIRRKRT